MGGHVQDASGIEGEARAVAFRLREAGHEAFFVGGSVRDRLLGLPVREVDIATSARPEEVQRLFPNSWAVGVSFGVVLVPGGRFHFDVATFREDGEYLDGRHPEGVRFATAREDVERRDFTVNGLLEDPVSGEVIDYVGGLEDLRRRELRAIGDPERRFREDSLRLLRGVRLAVTKGFSLEAGTWQALRNLAFLIGRVAPERVHQELDRIWLSSGRGRGLDLLMDSGLMGEVVPEFLALRGCEQPPQWHPEGDVYTHTRMMLDLLEGEPSLSLVWAVLLHDIGKPACFRVDETGRIRFNGHDAVGALLAGEILRRLKYSREMVQSVVRKVERHMQFMNVRSMRSGKLRLFMAGADFADELALHRADCLASNGGLENYDFVCGELAKLKDVPVFPQPLLQGRDLMALGLRPGPLFRLVLEGALIEQAEGLFTDRKGALKWLADYVCSASMA